MDVNEKKQSLYGLICNGEAAEQREVRQPEDGVLMLDYMNGDISTRFINKTKIFVSRHLSDHDLYHELKNDLDKYEGYEEEFRTIVDLLKSIYQDDEYWEPQTENTAVENNGVCTIKRPKIFISHNTKDKDYAEGVVNLLRSMGLKRDDIVCSSVSGYGSSMGNDIYEWLKDQFLKYDLHVIFLLSNNYYQSAASLNEMGAAWVLKKEYDTVVLPGYNFNEIRGAVNANQIGMDLNQSEEEIKLRANELRDRIIKKFDDNHYDEVDWDKGREKFVRTIKNLKTD